MKEPMSQLEISQSLPVEPARRNRLQTRQFGIDRIFEGGVITLSSISLLIMATLIVLLFLDASPAIFRYGINFITDSVWDPVFENSALRRLFLAPSLLR